MASLLRDRADTFALSTSTWRSILDSISTRLDENRDILRYLAGLLVFLGLLGTFWGLIETVSSVGNVIQGLKASGDSGSMFDSLRDGLAAPLSGMVISFSSSLFGLAGSLVLGFLDLQSSQAQNRFYTELEDWLSTTVYDQAAEPALGAGVSGELRSAVERLRGQEDDAPRVGQPIAAERELARHVAVLGQDRGQAREGVEARVRGEEQDQRGADR